MNEAFLFFVWKYRLFKKLPLISLGGEPIEIIKTGELNTDAGPDFFNARIRIADTLWAGNIEIHLRASDWLRHGHQHDKAYTNIILHIVYEADIKIDGISASVLELKDFLDRGLWEKYLQMSENALWIPCYQYLPGLNKLVLHACLDRMLAEKLEMKILHFRMLLDTQKQNWEEVFYHQLASAFGFRINSSPFQLLAASIPYTLLMRYRENSFTVEALLYGQSGLLSDYDGEDEYPKMLIKEYKHLSLKHGLKPMDAHLWKFLRLRPMNFPALRIAQFAHVIRHSIHLFRRILEAENLMELEELFNTEVSVYWQNHFVFGKSSKAMSKKMGKNSIHIILINSVLPFIFLYGKEKQEDKYCMRAIELLKEIPPERNSVLQKWEEAGIVAENAFDSQALLFLKENFCFQKKCLSCGIGKEILKN